MSELETKLNKMENTIFIAWRELENWQIPMTEEGKKLADARRYGFENGFKEGFERGLNYKEAEE